MTDMAREASGGAAASGTPDNAAGGTPTESDLPALQGLDADVPAGEGGLAAIAREGDDEQDDEGSARDQADPEDREIGDLGASQIGGAPTSASDPMPDPTGTSGS